MRRRRQRERSDRGRVLDILIDRRIWNFRSIAYSTMQYAMFLVMRDIRGSTPRAGRSACTRRSDDGGRRPSRRNDRLRLHQQNRYADPSDPRSHDRLRRDGVRAAVALHRICRREGETGYEVEHIWADHPERHSDEFAHPADFAEYRNRIGGLLLLPKSFNASYGDLPYEEKLEHYQRRTCSPGRCTPRLRAQPRFLRFIAGSSLPFTPHASFGKNDLDDRYDLIRQHGITKWHPRRLLFNAVE